MLEHQLQIRRRKQHLCYFRPMDDPNPAFPGSSAHTLQIKHGNPAIHESPSGGQHSESNTAAYFLWPGSTRLNDTAEERASYFWGLQKQLDSDGDGALPPGQQATTMLDLMIIRAFHSKILRRYSLGTAVGFRMRKGALTDIPAILVFVARKVHRRWLLDCQVLPTILVGPGGIWCDVDVVEFSYYTSLVATPKEQVYTELVEGLRGSDPCIGPGSQVSSQETYGTLGTIVRSRTGSHQVGFLTNRHVAVDLDYPNQKMFHPLPPNLGPGVYLGAVERATSFITDELWYGIFASSNPETFVRADGAFVPFSDSFDMSKVTTKVKGVGEMGEVMRVDLQAPVGSLIGKRVVKVGRSSGLTKGTILAYALEYNDEKGICFFTDFLVVGENRQTFDLEGDSGSLILVVGDDIEKPRPIGIIWGGTANRGRLKLKDGLGPENWTSAVDLGRLLDLLQLDLVTTDVSLQEGVEEKPECISNAASEPTVEELPPKGSTSPITSLTVKSKFDGCQTLHFEDMSSYGSRLAPQSSGIDMDVMFRQNDFVTRLAEPSTSVEHQFMQDFHVSLGHPNLNRNQFPENLSGLRDSKDGSNDDISIGLQLGDDTKRRRTA
ncbi:protein NARROW LEAF 1-like isoform X2 [Nymphaea colorata]|uniref:protein NARROW LEAF 1-like isoform X2 n=1 Tax=Nymphaea colorata TaxID=210225 RepID=UPI00129E5B1B|nr:protein NARROW LEAF 1-like isoform X2 [Nymphaea colorata]